MDTRQLIFSKVPILHIWAYSRILLYLFSSPWHHSPQPMLASAYCTLTCFILPRELFSPAYFFHISANRNNSVGERNLLAFGEWGKLQLWWDFLNGVLGFGFFVSRMLLWVVEGKEEGSAKGRGGTGRRGGGIRRKQRRREERAEGTER